MSQPQLAVAAAEILSFLDEKQRPACVIGGLAVARWGEPRATQDVDVAVLTEFGSEPAVLGELLSRFPSRVPNPHAFAAANRIALLVLADGVHADVSLAAFPFEREAIERASLWELAPQLQIRTCSAEDLIVYKLVAGRPIDVHDVTRIVNRQGRRLDAERIRHWGRLLADLKEDPDLLRPFDDAWRRFGLDT